MMFLSINLIVAVKVWCDDCCRAAAVGLPGIIFKFKIYQMECEI